MNTIWQAIWHFLTHFSVLQYVIGIISYSILISAELWIRHFIHSKEIGKVHDHHTVTILVYGAYSSIFISLALAIAFPTFKYYGTQSFYFGIMLMLAGTWLRVTAVRTLDKSFSFEVQVAPTQKIIRTGPYGYARHPAYTASIMYIVAMPFTFESWWAVGFCLIASVASYLPRIRVEEQVLQQHFREDYPHYCQQVPYRLIPYLW